MYVVCVCVYIKLVYKELMAEDYKMTLKSTFISSHSFLNVIFKTNVQLKITYTLEFILLKETYTKETDPRGILALFSFHSGIVTM